MIAPERKIAIGNQSSFTAPTATFPFEYALDRGFDAFEWFPDTTPEGYGFSEEKLSAARRRDLRNLALAHGLRQSVHAPWWIDPSEPEGRARLRTSVDFARDVGATLITIHAQPRRDPASFARTIAPIARELHEGGLRLAVENTVESSPETVNELFFALARLAGEAYESAGFCLDIGHANLCAATRNDYLAFIDALAPNVRVIHAHLHENWGDRDAHLPLFCGPSKDDPSGIEGLLERLVARGYDGALILEQWPDPPELLDNARERLLAILDEVGRAPRGEGE